MTKITRFRTSLPRFARFAAEVYAANGVEVYLPDPEGAWILSTPELSYAIRALNAHGGLNVARVITTLTTTEEVLTKKVDRSPPNDEIFSELVERVRTVSRIRFEEGRSSGRINSWITSHPSWICQPERGLSQRPEARGIKVVLTNLQGGRYKCGRCSHRGRFEVHYVPEQRKHDGQFPNVPYQLPIPSTRKHGYGGCPGTLNWGDAVLSTDPDADRMESWPPIRTKFQMARATVRSSLPTRYSAADSPEPSQTPLFVTTEVTSRLPVAVLWSMEPNCGQPPCWLQIHYRQIWNSDDRKIRNFVGGADAYVMGLEESHGLMVYPSAGIRPQAGTHL